MWATLHRLALPLLVVVTTATPGSASQTTMRSTAMVELVSKLIPTVVNITAHHVAAPLESGSGRGASFSRVREALGSGFVVDPDGSIVTNRHVVDGAYEIVVTFSNGRSVDAKLIWKSAAVDVAFLKVDVGRPLPAATLAANQKVQIGERVLAVGNPLGLGTSVSAGIVSALDRNIKESPYDAFIQTDAAINHGSSGGPLFNEDGEVVGINTALYTSVTNGGSQGLGFAIPGRDVAFLIDQLKRYKRIRAGWLGTSTQKLTPEMAEALNYGSFFGTIVASVAPNSPAADAGLRLGDIVQSFDGEPMFDATTLSRAAAMSFGKHVMLGIWRDGKAFDVPVTIVEDTKAHDGEPAANIEAPRFASLGDMGLRVAPLENGASKPAPSQANIKGLVVTAVASDSVAQEAGLRPGDVIVSAQMNPIQTIDALETLILEQAQSGRHAIIVLVQSAGGERWIALPLRL